MRWDELDLAEQLMTEREFAALIRQKLQTVQKWRHEGRCPPHFKNGNKVVLFRRRDVAEWLARHYVQPTKVQEIRETSAA